MKVYKTKIGEAFNLYKCLKNFRDGHLVILKNIKEEKYKKYNGKKAIMLDIEYQKKELQYVVMLADNNKITFCINKNEFDYLEDIKNKE